MSGVKVEHLVKADPETTFRAFADIPRAAEMVAGIERIEMLSEGPVGIGTRWRETRIMYGRTATEEMTITAFEPRQGYTSEAESHGTRYVTRYTFAPEVGGTRVTLDFTGRPVTLGAKLMMPLALLFRGTIRRMLAQDMADVAAHAERKAAAS
ncbi:MAG: SRPBCC family protein [Inquilinus sp.]|nr:SRPBCC family protein [Inquilinus sp.]